MRRRRESMYLCLTMTPLSFRICLTTVTLLYADFTIGLDLQDFVNTLKVEEKFSENDSRQQFMKNSLVIFIPDLPYELAEENYPEDRKRLLRNQDLSGELLKEDNDELGIPATSIIKKNSSNNATHVLKWTGLNRRSKERMHIREQQAMEQREKDHERRVKEIIDHVSVHYQSCIYLAYEAQRIKTDGIVMDDLRKLAEDVEKQKYQGLKAKALKCGKPIHEPTPFVWPKPNKVRIDVVKDSLNDGVY